MLRRVLDNIAWCVGHFHIIKGGVFVANIIKAQPSEKNSNNDLPASKKKMARK
jgi:hypothetical protein